MTALFRPEDIACTANLKIAHGYAEACTELGKFADR